MSWVRIHDGAITHPKVSGMTDKAFRLWVWGLSNCQQYLTDGLIVADTVPGRLKGAVAELVKRRLWEAHDIGYKVHDYLDWNDSRETVLSKRSGAKRRLDDWREAQSEARNALPSGDVKRVSLPTSETLLARSGVGVRKKSLSSESKWPIFKGNRLVVFDWMLTELQRTLGPHSESMEWDTWLDDADRKAAGRAVVEKNWWPWLQGELEAYASQRGWVVGEAPAAETGEAKYQKQLERDVVAVRALLQKDGVLP